MHHGKNLIRCPILNHAETDGSMKQRVVFKRAFAIVSGGANYLLNPEHSDYSKIKLLNTVRLEFDTV